MTSFIIIFVMLFIVVIVLTLFLCIIGPVREFLSRCFDSRTCKSLRFILLMFAILASVVGSLKWYAEAREPWQQTVNLRLPTLQKAETDLQKAMQGTGYEKEVNPLHLAENFLFFDVFSRLFQYGWQPAVVVTDDRMASQVRFFADASQKGTLLTKKEIDKTLEPNSTWASVGDFYLPPNAELTVKRFDKNGQSFTKLIIQDRRMVLTIEFTVFEDIYNFHMIYEKRGFWNQVWFDYSEDDHWVEIILSRLRLVEEVEKRMAAEELSPNVQTWGTSFTRPPSKHE